MPHYNYDAHASEYNSWSQMKTRCSNPNVKEFKYYGARGISVCERWHDFENFFSDMGEKPGAEYSLERVNNDAGYSPDNCKWATPAEQQRNNRQAKLTMKDAREIRMLYREGYTQLDLAKEFNVNPSTISRVVNNIRWEE